MQKISEIAKKYYYASALVCWGMYCYVTLVATKVQGQIGVSAAGVYMLKVSFVLLYGLVLVVGMQSILKIWEYAAFMKGKALGINYEGINKIGYGLLWLLFGFMLSVTVSAIRGIILPTGANITVVWKTLTIVTNYLWILFPALGLWNILFGAMMAAGNKTKGHLLSSARHRENLVVAAIFSVVITVLYGFITFTNPNRQVSVSVTIRPTYVISDFWILLTLVLPSLFVWVIGMLAAFELDQISPKIDRSDASITIRQGRRRLVNGLWEVIFSSILIQAILSLGGARLYSLGIFFILISVYGIFIFLLIGYGTIFSGAKKLLFYSNR